MPEAIDVEKLIQNAREQFERGATWDQGIPHASPRAAPDLPSLARANRSLRFRKSLVGQIPPAPPTLRARLGGVLVRMISRSLFWFTGRLDDFHSSVVETSELQSSALASLAWNGQQTRQLLDRVNAHVQELSFAVTAKKTARERAEWELGDGADESASRIRVLEASCRRLEIAVQQMQSSDHRSEAEAGPENRTPFGANPLTQVKRRWEIGICSAFDANTYGGLLFPLIAESELKRRLGDVTLRCFSRDPKTPSSGPSQATSISELPEVIPSLDGLLIGGGWAPESGLYRAASSWLSPALMALQHNVPLAWNSIGVAPGEAPDWAKPLLELALGLSSYVSVRDDLSQATLQPFACRPITLVPDIAFGLPNLVDVRNAPSAEFVRITKTYGLESPYIVLQPERGFEPLIHMIQNRPERFDKFQLLVLPARPKFDEHSRRKCADLPRAILLEEWPDPLVSAELIGRSEGLLGDDLHFSISALVAGVPVFRRIDLATGEFTGFKNFETIFLLPPEGHVDSDWLLKRLGRKAPSDAALAALDHHWNRIAAMLQTEKPRTAPALSSFWLALPSLLERGGEVQSKIEAPAGHATPLTASTGGHAESLWRFRA
jgi:lipopolysaccharide transport system ATP-binding protein